ncbi:hypothetical protein DFQ28_001941 [Apophysomyces sp. BC1034]|nr:hypothetical protein DFQ28_001941 [Apophysomyces sp. BC1034]
MQRSEMLHMQGVFFEMTASGNDVLKKIRQVSDPAQLWNCFSADLRADYLHRYQQQSLQHTLGNLSIEDESTNSALRDIERVLRAQGSLLANFPSLPQHVSLDSDEHTAIFEAGLDYDTQYLHDRAVGWEAMF